MGEAEKRSSLAYLERNYIMNQLLKNVVGLALALGTTGLMFAATLS